MISSISKDREQTKYRVLEASIGIFSISFLLILVVLAFVNPVFLAVFIIAYSFMMLLKVSLHGIYTIYTYKNMRRWENADWKEILLATNTEEIKQNLVQLRNRYRGKLDWEHKLNEDIQILKTLENTPFAQPKNIIHIPIFAVYDESFEVIARSLHSIYDSGYDLSKVFVFISQEARVGEEMNEQMRTAINTLDWVNGYNLSEKNLALVYHSEHTKLDYQSEIWQIVENKENKLTVIFTQHPDGLVGEIKGKASNEDWGGRQASLFIKSRKINPEIVVLTSLDSDSRVGNHFFQMLSLRYCLTPDRLQCGFQPLPIYSNNFFQSNLFPRLVATNTTIWHMIQYNFLEEMHFFANYSVPLITLQKIDFWVREVIAEDSMLFAKCLVSFAGKFRVVPFYGTFEGDVVEADDYLEAISNQYRQLQRWAWGGIEGFPYKFKNFFWTEKGNKIDLRIRLKFITAEFLNHFYWSTLPVVFSVITFLPQMVSNEDFKESTIALNLWTFSQYFAWISFLFLGIYSYITFGYIAKRAVKNIEAKWYHWLLVVLQWIISPFIVILWGPPAIDAQIRGIFGWYLGYWVTPKKK